MTDRSHKIEFAMPYYGRRDHAQTAVRSVLSQSDSSWNLRIVQDGPDVEDLSGWVMDLADERVTYHVNETGLGLSGNFQRCLDLAMGTHVVFLGCDDAVEPDYVRVVSAALSEHAGATAVHPAVSVMDTNGRPARASADRIKHLLAPRSQTASTLSGEQLMTSLLRGNWVYFPAVCWDRERVAQLGFRQDLPVTLDLALMTELVLNGGTLVVLPQTLFRYRRHGASASSVAARNLERFSEESRLFAEVGMACRARGWPRAARAARWHITSRLHAATLLPSALNSGDGPRAARLLRHVVRS